MSNLILNTEGNLKDYLVRKYIENGFDVHYADNIDEAHRLINEQEITNIFIDYPEKKEEWLELLIEVQMEERPYQLQIVFRTDETGLETLRFLQLIRPVGILSPVYTDQEVFEKLYKIFKLDNNERERRVHVRVIPADKENITINIKIPSADMISSGKITDISMGGLAFEFEDKLVHSAIKEEQILKDTELKLNGESFTVNLKVIYNDSTSDGFFTACMFLNPSDYLLNKLSRIIYTGIQH